MSLLFLVPLMIGLLSGYASRLLTNEDAEVLGFTSVTNLMLSLVLAPWQLKLLLLIVLINNRKQG